MANKWLLLIFLSQVLREFSCTKCGTNTRTVLDFISDIFENDVEYDFIIVGAGSAGSVIANRLSSDPNVNALLLEAGGEQTIVTEIPVYYFLAGVGPTNWDYLSEPQTNACFIYKNKQCRMTRGKVLGGSSSINGMMYIRGNRRDYDGWKALGNEGWGYEDVLPYFIKSEDNQDSEYTSTRYHGRGGCLTVSNIAWKSPLHDSFLEAGREMNYTVRDINGEFQTGFMSIQSTIRHGSRCSTAKAFLTPILERPNLTILTHATATKVLFRNKRAVGVSYNYLGISRNATARKEVILSAGTIASPQLLLLSGIGPKEQLDKFQIPPVAYLPGVGENYNDHVPSAALVFTAENPITLQSGNLYSPTNIKEWLMSKRGVLTSPGGFEAVAFVNTKFANNRDDYPDVELILSPFALTNQSKFFMHSVSGYTNEFLDGYVGKIGNKDAFSIFLFQTRPKSIGYVRLRSVDPFAHPIIEPNYFSHPQDIKVLVEGIKIAVSIGQSNAFKRFGAKLIPFAFPGCENHLLFSDEYWTCFAKSSSTFGLHCVGTCKMGNNSDPMAVLDSELRVRGVEGLRVADASIMPSVISGNTNAAAMMIGEKAADMIKKRWDLVAKNDVC